MVARAINGGLSNYVKAQKRLDTRHRTRDYFAFQWPLIDFCAYEAGVDRDKIVN